MTWTQAICTSCWNEQHPVHPVSTQEHGVLEVCAWCGKETKSGIYVRADPASVPHPR